MIKYCLACLCLLMVLPVIADTSRFTKGPVIMNFGENTVIEGGLSSPESQNFKVLFDISDKNETDKPHRSFNSVARFINMHVRAGVPLKKINAAMVVHGGASTELMNAKAFKKRFNKDHTSIDLLKNLKKTGVKIIVCGQSAAYHGINKEDLAAGIEMSLSAMTANALLQQQGYTLNPF